jgi:hypothetical protein
MSEYNKLKKKGLSKGRKPLSAEERQQRAAVVQMKQESRRRAGIVLQHKYAEEFAALCELEFKALLSQKEKN